MIDGATDANLPDDQTSSISVRTRRTSKGLLDPLIGYPVWFGLKPSGAGLPPSDHLADHRTYIRMANVVDEEKSKQLTPPVAPRTIVLRESKEATDDFIRTIDAMVRTAEGWEYHRFSRSQATEGFQKAADSGECAKCHSGAANDEVFSELTLVD